MKSFSIREAAAIAEIPESKIRTAIEKRSISPKASRVGRSTRYRFYLNELLYLKLLNEFPFSLPKPDKESLRRLVGKSSGSAGRWKLHGSELLLEQGTLSVSLSYEPLQNQIVRNVTSYLDGLNRIVSSPEILGGEPVFSGTRIPLQHIAGLIVKEVTEKEILEDYPALSDADLAFAAIYARMTPPPGRPRKPLTFKRSKVA